MLAARHGSIVPADVRDGLGSGAVAVVVVAVVGIVGNGQRIEAHEGARDQAQPRDTRVLGGAGKEGLQTHADAHKGFA